MQLQCMVETEAVRRDGLPFIAAYVRRLARLEATCVVVVFLALLVALFAFKMVRVDQFRGDSAMYLQATENVAHGKALASQVQASIIDFLDENKFQDLHPDDIRQDPDSLFGHASSGERSLLLGHAYFILYPLAELARFFSAKAVLLFCYAASFVGMLLLAYWLLRRSEISILGALAFCLLIVAQPAWTDGLLWGQFYPDRLFLLVGLLIMALTSNRAAQGARTKNWARFSLLAAAVACASINERGAIVPGLFMMLYAVLYWKKPNVERYVKLGLGAALLCYGVLVVKALMPSDQNYGSFLPTSWHQLIALTHMPQFLPMVELFLLVNLPLFCLALFEWRAAIIAAVLMLPNIFGSIGGAEKIGWSTHYPSFYFTPLVWAALTGYITLHRKFKTTRQRAVVFGGVVLSIIFLAMLNPAAYQPFSISASNTGQSFWPAFSNQARSTLFSRAERVALAQDVAGLQQAIPSGSTVSSVEAGMPHIYRGRTIEYFPADIDHADYAVLSARVIDGITRFGGTINFNTPDERQQVDDVVTARLKRDGYDLAHPLLFPQLDGLAVVKRVH